jgi:polyhydroxyalkanoate synthesis regulator phasin
MVKMLAVKKFLIYYQSNPHRRGELRSPKMPMSASELKNLDKNIVRLKAQLANKRDTLVTIAPEEKVRLQQQIEDLREQIRDLERDQWQLISQMTGDLAISNEEAEPIVAELVTEVESVKQQPDQLSPEILELLQQILAKLNAPNTPAAAKLKAAISTLPPFVSLTYEAELDTESTFRTYFPTFNRYLKGVKERLKK